MGNEASITSRKPSHNSVRHSITITESSIKNDFLSLARLFINEHIRQEMKE